MRRRNHGIGIRWAPLVSCGLLSLALPLRAPECGACVVGDPEATPTVEITGHPGDCCYGEWAGPVSGVANNLDTDLVAIRLYARTDNYYIQPLQGSLIEIDCEGRFSSQTHGGRQYAAILCDREWEAPDVLEELPPLGGEILAIDRQPERRISFAGLEWIVKSSRAGRADPGPNYWSDDEESVWVDAEGALHLTIREVGGDWLCSEVESVDPVDYGSYTFHTQGLVDRFDPCVVLGLFLYERVDQEIDIEYSRWCEAGGQNGQFVVQPWTTPGNRHRFSFTQGDPLLSSRIAWQPGGIEFQVWEGHSDEAPADPADLVAGWSYTGPDIPAAPGERIHINLWLVDGAPPADGQEVEVVVGRVEATPALRATWGGIRAGYR